MRESAAKGMLFAELRILLQTVGSLDNVDANIYGLGLEKGIITSSDVAKEIDLSQSASGERLKKLAERGFFMHSLTEPGGKGGKGRARRFAVVSPRIALAENLKNYERMVEYLDQVDEHLEVLSEEGPTEEENWVVRAESLADHFVESVDSAKESIWILANDCTFAADEDIVSALGRAVERGLDVQVLSRSVPKKERNRLQGADVDPRRIDYVGPVIAVVDKRLCYLPYRYGKVTRKYGAILTTNEYTVGKYLALCERTAEGAGE